MRNSGGWGAFGAGWGNFMEFKSIAAWFSSGT
jgi:hypothetical protein